MGLFETLFGRRVPTRVVLEPDRVWISTAAKMAGLRREVGERSASDSAAIVLVAHFPDLLEPLQRIADAQHGPVPVVATLAKRLSGDVAHGLKLDDSTTIEMIVAERHPLPSVDAQLAEFAEGLPCRCRLVHHLSLEDPLVGVFAGDWVRNVLEQLGMQENEAIESPLVTRRIKAAQKKIETSARGTADANSAAEWFAANFPSGLRF